MNLDVAYGVRQLEAVDVNKLKSGILDINDVRKKYAPDFLNTFKSLLSVMRIEDNKEEAKKEKMEKEETLPALSIPIMSSTMRSGHKRLASLDASALRTREEEGRQPPILRVVEPPKTPDQATHPEDPNYSGASADSGATGESKDEENTKQLLSDLLRDSMTVLEHDFAKITWQNSGYDVQLCLMFNSYITISNISRKNRTKFVLGYETIIAINDDGLGLEYIHDGNYRLWQLNGKNLPVLSLEVPSFMPTLIIPRLNES